MTESPLFILAAIIACGILAGEMAKRLHLPSVTGQIVVGVILGPSLLGIFTHDAAMSLRTVVHFALALIAVNVGSHLHLPPLKRAARRLLWLVVMESLLIPAAVFFAVTTTGLASPLAALILGTLAVSTAPATIVALIKETRSRGIFVSTLMAGVALNNIACITLFEIGTAAAEAGITSGGEAVFLKILGALLAQVVGGAGLGIVVGLMLVAATRHVVQPEKLTTASLISIFLTAGLADLLGFSPLLACLFLGAAISNLAPDKEEIGHRVFANFEPAVLAIFFTLAGVELHLEHLAEAGLVAAVVVTARFAAKSAAGYTAMRIADAPAGLRRYLGPALIPQAGVAIGLILRVENGPLYENEGVGPLFLAIGVTTVALNEIVGPLLTRLGLVRSGDFGKDRPRLIDFLREENIVTDFTAESKEDAIERLVDLLMVSHRPDIDRDALLRCVLERERELSTCVGRGLFVPHGEVEGIDRMLGVLALSKEGLPFKTPDGRSVKCLLLLATPAEERERHLEVLATLSRWVGMDRAVQVQLYNARSPAHVFEILHAEEFENYNYFLED